MPLSHDALRRAIELHGTKHYDRAERLCRYVLSIEPQNCVAWHLLGRLAQEVGNLHQALEFLNQAILCNQNYAGAYDDLGVVLRASGRISEAMACHRHAVELAPTSAEPNYNLGVILQAEGQLDEAIVYYRRALAQRPDLEVGHYNLGISLLQRGDARDAMRSFQRSIELNPQHADRHYNLGLSLAYQAEYGGAIACHRRAIELEPQHAKAHSALGIMLLLQGDLTQGWPEYAWRWKTEEFPPRTFGWPLWQGEDVSGRSVLLTCEQGFGDTIQFIRFAPLVKERGAQVILECPRRLLRLLKSASGIDQLVTEGESLPPFDFHVPLLNLPHLFSTSIETIPRRVPYLHADTDLIRVWRERLKEAPGCRIGVNWRGREGKGEFRKRDIPLDAFRAIAQLAGVNLISLQKGAGDDVQSLPQVPIVDLGPDIDASGAFTDTAAIMMNLNLVITSDTSVAHLAGALGVEVWLALPLVSDWRWLLERSDSPWYPTMRLFRQQSLGDWTGVFAEIAAALRKRLGH